VNSHPDPCIHGQAQQLGLISSVPDTWMLGASLPNDGAEHESAWCRDCQHYLWRELGSTYWTALNPPLS
jgi:hypothetical protein